MLECWSAGVLECWSAGVLECWSVDDEKATAKVKLRRLEFSQLCGSLSYCATPELRNSCHFSSRLTGSRSWRL